jgi:transcriptional regulator with XRE-family HTH domain
MSAESIRATRQRLRISQSELARRANVSRWKLNTYELGDSDRLDRQELSRIETVFRTEMRDLASVGAN